VTYDLHAEGTNGVTGQTIVTAIDGFPIEGGISVWNVDATGASSIDAIWATSTGAVGVRGRSTFNGVGVRGEVSNGTGDGVQGQGSGSFSGVAGFGGGGVDAGTGVFGLGGVAQPPRERRVLVGVPRASGGSAAEVPPQPRRMRSVFTVRLEMEMPTACRAMVAGASPVSRVSAGVGAAPACMVRLVDPEMPTACRAMVAGATPVSRVSAGLRRAPVCLVREAAGMDQG
jgi:hypothetical protein